jgi:hypothetical protein
MDFKEMITEVDINTWTGRINKDLIPHALEDIESGKVIFMPSLKFTLSKAEEQFLTPHCADPKSKNISYDRPTSVLKGSTCTGVDLIHLQQMMDRFAKNARELIDTLFPHYNERLQWGRTSYRPTEVAGRKVSSYRKDDSRLHVDSFSSTPVQGFRLLRVFSNINPCHPRVWKLGEPFETVATRFLPHISQKQWINPYILHKLRITKSLRTSYDHLMLQIHNRMKGDMTYQQTANQIRFSFPPSSTWIVMTDQVSHAALSGQFLLEQTFYLPSTAMKLQEHAPLSILERLTGRSLVEERKAQ